MDKYTNFQQYIYELEDLVLEHDPKMHSDTAKSILIRTMDHTLKCFEASMSVQECFKGYYE